MLLFTEDQANQIIALPKTIRVPFPTWAISKNHSRTLVVELPVEVDYPCSLTLRISFNLRTKCSSFVLLADNMRIKALDLGKSHRNPDGKLVPGLKHKHSWKDPPIKDRWAYVPDDITDGAPLEQTFREFLAECNIHFNGSFTAPTVIVQKGLEMSSDAVQLPKKRAGKRNAGPFSVH